MSASKPVAANPPECASTTCSALDQSGMLARLMATLDGMLFRCAIDAEWTMYVVSQGSEALTGYRPEEFGAVVSYEQLTHPDDRQRVRQTILQAVRAGAQYQLEYRINSRDGGEKWVLERGAAVCLEDGEVVLEGFIEDITARCQLQQRMQEAELRYRSIFENSVIGMFQTTIDGQYQAANQALAALYKYDTPAELMADIADIGTRLYVEPKRREEFKQLMQRQGRVCNFESEIYCRDGSRIWIAESAHAVPGPDGTIDYYQGTVENVTERRQRQSELEHRATHDALTGLPNRNLLHDRLQQAIGHARRCGYFAAVVFIDLDDFKGINDRLGHQAGDILLIEIAHRLQGALRATDTVARYAGDEFVLVLNNYYQGDSIARMLQRLLGEIAKPVPLDDGQELLVTCSIGVSLYPNDGDSPEQLLRHADSAMYQAKQGGKGKVRFFGRQPLGV